MKPREQVAATEVRPDRRWPGALWWSLPVLVPALVVARLGGHGPVILALGAAIAAAVFVAFLRARPAVVTAEEIRLPRRTIRRADVASITRVEGSTALVFRDTGGGILGLADLHELAGRFHEALRAHDWPEVGDPA